MRSKIISILLTCCLVSTSTDLVFLDNPELFEASTEMIDTKVSLTSPEVSEDEDEQMSRVRNLLEALVMAFKITPRIRGPGYDLRHGGFQVGLSCFNARDHGRASMFC